MRQITVGNRLLRARYNSTAYEKYKYGYLGNWYIKSTPYTRRSYAVTKFFQKQNNWLLAKPRSLCTLYSICLNIGF